ncbi:DUF2066 domain-containing protein [Thiomicrorhabdus xiamenensis]|uniref:DUF2066 domain-containing protein n=1 Tax=Thiomicrorhabdus xiamenensis TaxID=2739063 RepID=A0A7D4SIB9_9GAMM|nr:DUF2066 domain-containing protein [Thiomicrorhabdus xiamenensis]QKI89460.1 DUF2066 domain-containing protein [Thiomicrorhabdus xiamenensis]
MRSFQQILLYSAMTLSVSGLTAQTALAVPEDSTQLSVSDNVVPTVLEKDLYAVELDNPNPEATIEYKLSEPVLNQLAEEGMRLLLVRLTGKRSLLSSPRTESLLSNSRRWLKSYAYVPVMQEGVKVGLKIRLKYDEVLLKQALAEMQIKVWPLNLRPKLLVMGTLVESNTITKLDQEALGYRVDINLQDYAEQLALPVSWPQETMPWIYPINPVNNITPLQDVLVQSDQNNLLSFKLVRREQEYELSWHLFADNGSILAKGKTLDSDRQTLLHNMLDMVAARLVEVNRQILDSRDQISINLSNIGDIKSLQQAKTQLQQALPTVTEIKLVTVEQDSARLEVAYRGDYANFIGWLERLSQFSITSSSEMLRQIDMRFQYVEPVEEVPELPEVAQ